MPAGLQRYYGSNDLHFITFSCYHRQPWLGMPQRRDLLLTVLEQVRLRYCFVVFGYVVMPDHVHLLISEPQRGTPSTVVQALKLGFSRRALSNTNRNTRRPGQTRPVHRIWERRFYDFNVWTERKRIEKLRYLHRNPVKRGFVTHPDQWPWSSFRAYAYGETGVVAVNEWQILKLRTCKVKPTPSAIVG